MKETFASVCLVKDIRPPVFSALLTYIYTDTLQLQRPEDITELLVVANQVNSPHTSNRKHIRFRRGARWVRENGCFVSLGKREHGDGNNKIATSVAWLVSAAPDLCRTYF